MNKKTVYCLAKKLAAGILAIGMIVAGIVIVPEEADAAVVEDKVIYDGENYKITDYWKKDNKIAPVKEGYVFGGWYADNQGKDYLSEEEAATATTETKAYAKFVPAKVLSVKAQNMADTTATTPTTYVRVISSLDSKNYQKVGFDIWLANKTQLLKDDDTPLETDKIYDGLLVGQEKRHATTIFGGVSKYVSVWQLTNVANSNFSKIIYVRPYWITMDGTKVEGLAKYVHIEDEYKGYISVPVNLLTGEEVAAGMLSMTYNQANTETANTDLTVVGFEAGRLLPEMEFYHDTASKTIKMVGNATTANETVYADGIYANVRFAKPSVTTDFEIVKESLEFCNWDEKFVSIEKVWDIEYDAQQTTSK